jgi:2',3'-cyclic-nucleotide 2'-phosphodiesterase (5'-nucleotidase family)
LNNTFNFDVKTLGNHESYIPLEDFAKALLKLGKSSYLATTLSNKHLPALYRKLIRQGVIQTQPLTLTRIHGQYGFTSMLAEPNERLQKHSFPLPDATALSRIVRQARRLKEQGVSLTTLLSHRGDKWDREFTNTIECNDLDLINGGHSHKPISNLEVFTKRNGKPVVVTNSGGFSDFVGVLDIELSEKGPIPLSNRLYSVKGFPLDPKITALLEEHFGNIDPVVTLRATDDPILDFVKQPHFLAETAREITDSQIGIVRSNEYRKRLEDAVTPLDVQTALAYKEPLVKMTLSGREIETSIQKSFEDSETESFPIFSGLKFKAPHGKPESIQVETRPDHWEPLDPNQQYTIGLCKYMVDPKTSEFPALSRPENITKQYDLTMAQVMLQGLQERQRQGSSELPPPKQPVDELLKLEPWSKLVRQQTNPSKDFL